MLNLVRFKQITQRRYYQHILIILITINLGVFESAHRYTTYFKHKANIYADDLKLLYQRDTHFNPLEIYLKELQSVLLDEPNISQKLIKINNLQINILGELNKSKTLGQKPPIIFNHEFVTFSI